jgi:seryl-tRNA synthetase
MLDIKFIRENLELIKDNCKKRDVAVDVNALIQLDEKRRENQQSTDQLRAQRKSQSKGKPSEEDIIRLRKIGDEITALETQALAIEGEYKDLLLRIPNLTHPDTPIGGEEDFKTISTHKEPPHFAFPPKDHEELMLNLDLIDFERGGKVATSKFYFAKNNLVRLNQALINYGIDILSANGKRSIYQNQRYRG